MTSDPVEEFEVAIVEERRLHAMTVAEDDPVIANERAARWASAVRRLAGIATRHGPTPITRMRAAEAAEKYRKAILRDAGAPDDADNICCCGGKLDEAGIGWSCSHGGCRSMADYCLSKKIEALPDPPEEPLT